MAVRHRSRSTGAQSQCSNGNTLTAKGPHTSKTCQWSYCLWFIVIILAGYLLAMAGLRTCSWLQRAVIFVHHFRQPLFSNFSDHASFGLNSTMEFELFHEDGCEIETWHILPSSYHEIIKSNSDSEYFIRALSDNAPIILYLHGNTGTRALLHRVEIYKFLAQRGYHVIAFDYRGFGNSDCYPSELGTMEDSKLVYNWIRSKAPQSKVYIWGHSLGAAVATHLSQELCSAGDQPDGLILDAPFTDLPEAGVYHPLSLPFWPIRSFFKHFVLDTFTEQFKSADRVKHITCPMLILHGRNDYIIPYHLGEKFHRIALEYKKVHPEMGNIEFIDCGDSNHKSNYKAPPTQEALNWFIKK